VNVRTVALGPDVIGLAEDLDLSHAAPLLRGQFPTPFGAKV
jgi:hypothetical protein